MYRILVVEDEMEISSIVKKYIQKEGHHCEVAENGLEALDLFSREKFHLLILDIMMPGIGGFEVLSSIRQVSDVPVIILTAKEEEIDRIKGFDKGADDYVLKPFSPRELMRRIKVFLKRTYHLSDEIILQAGEIKLYTESMKVYKKESEVTLTSTEFNLLHELMKNMNHVLSRDQLIDLAFGADYEGFDRNIDSYIKRIRQKIESDPKNPTYLKTKYGQGYVFGGDTNAPS